MADLAIPGSDEFSEGVPQTGSSSGSRMEIIVNSKLLLAFLKKHL
jgi:hypothetical protein